MNYSVTAPAMFKRLLAVTLFTLFSLCCAVVPPIAHAATATSPPYGEVGQPVGGFDTGLTYDGANDTALSTTGTSGDAAFPADGKLVYPLGMAVDNNEPTSVAPGGTAIYVLDNLNPQAIDNFSDLDGSGLITGLSMSYRIQEFVTEADGTINPTPISAATFTLASSTDDPGERAVSLAVDPWLGRVYVLIDDVPADLGRIAAEKIDFWQTDTLTPDTTDFPTQSDTETGGTELVTPATLQPDPNADGSTDIGGESIALAGTQGSEELTLGGNQYQEPTSSAVVPTIEAFGNTTGAADTTKNSGSNGGLWQDAADTEDDAGGQPSDYLAALSANPDGTLNATFVTRAWEESGDWTTKHSLDQEPNMATIPSSLTGVQATVLPTASAISDSYIGPNSDAAATDGTGQDVGVPVQTTGGSFAPTGGTVWSGTLAPSVTELEGANGAPLEDADENPIYAGLFASAYSYSSSETNPQGLDGSVWTTGFGSASTNPASVTAKGDLAIRVFDGATSESSSEGSAGTSLAMIGNDASDLTQYQPCKISGGPAISGSDDGDFSGSYMALAPGANGVIYALVQPDLWTTATGQAFPTDPDNPAGALNGQGDELLEFAPQGSSTANAAGSSWSQCPQPSDTTDPNGAFAVTNVSNPDTSYSSPGPITIQAGTELAFNAGNVNFKGGVPWAYDWSVDDTANNGADCVPPWTNASGQCTVGLAWSTSGSNWTLAAPGPEDITLAATGSYTASLGVVNDFGTFNGSQTIDVVNFDAASFKAAFTPSATTVTAGQAVSFDASASTAPQFDSIIDYNWQFGPNGAGDDKPTSTDSYTYNTAGTYTVTLQITDALGHQTTKAEQVTVKAASTPPPAATAPGAPTGVSATAGNGSATISWTPPSSNGGSAITGYTVAGTPGGSCTTTATSCTISGLANGTSYTFSVTASNAAGTGPAGTSNAVTPTAPSAGSGPGTKTPPLKLTPSNDVLKPGVTSTTLVLQFKSVKVGTKLTVKLTEPKIKKPKIKSAKVGANNVLHFATGKLPSGVTKISFFETVGKGKKAKLKLVKTETVHVTLKHGKK